MSEGVPARRLRWGAGGWSDDGCPPPDDALLVDSFLGAEGRVRDRAAHEERFRAGCAALGLDPDLHGFLTAVRATLPAEGRWFPRIEAHPDGRLVLWLRPAPAAQQETRLWIPPEPDPRRHPTLKGPDLAALAALRRQAMEHGADDALLVGPDGLVREAAHAGLLWWRAGALCLPDPALPVLPSVTAARIVRAARAEGVPVVPERCSVEALADAEVWTVNALHGIRPVVGWRGAGAPVHTTAPDETRLAHFRAHLTAPTSTEPSAADAAARLPVTAEPVAAEPATAEPATAEPATAEPPHR